MFSHQAIHSLQCTASSKNRSYSLRREVLFCASSTHRSIVSRQTERARMRRARAMTTTTTKSKRQTIKVNLSGHHHRHHRNNNTNTNTRTSVVTFGWRDFFSGNKSKDEDENSSSLAKVAAKDDDENEKKSGKKNNNNNENQSSSSTRIMNHDDQKADDKKIINVVANVSETLNSLDALLGPDLKKIEEERREREEEEKYKKQQRAASANADITTTTKKEGATVPVDNKVISNDDDEDERTKKIREENRKKFRVDLTKSSLADSKPLLDLKRDNDESDDSTTTTNTTTSSQQQQQQSRDEKLEKVLQDLGKIAQRKKQKEESGETSNDLDEDELKLQKQFDALLDILEEPGIPPVSAEDIEVIKKEIFGMQTFFVTSVETIGGDSEDFMENQAQTLKSSQAGTGALFRGNLRKDRQLVWDEVREKIYSKFDNKYEVFLLEEPAALSANSPGPGETLGDNKRGPRVSFLVVPADRAGPAEDTSAWQYLIALVLVGFTVGSAVQLGLVAEVSRLPEETLRWLAEGAQQQGGGGVDLQIDPNQPPPGLENFDTVAYVEAALPITGGVLLSSLMHELGHRIVAAQRDVKLSIPYLIPNGQLGTFGTITQLKSIPETRTDFLDISIAGPLAGGITAFALWTYGLILSIGHDPACVPIPANLFGSSLLLGGISELILTGGGATGVEGAAVVAEAGKQIVVHPLFIAGWYVCVLRLFSFFLSSFSLYLSLARDSMKTKCFTDFPLSDSLVILNHTRSSAAEAKTSMTLRIIMYLCVCVCVCVCVLDFVSYKLLLFSF